MRRKNTKESHQKRKDHSKGSHFQRRKKQKYEKPLTGSVKPTLGVFRTRFINRGNPVKWVPIRETGEPSTRQKIFEQKKRRFSRAKKGKTQFNFQLLARKESNYHLRLRCG